ncbi:hypothetical protein [Shewanella sp. 10N.286.52.A9]|uniref:hypothetical protein n=1 Tax=Shewanella sp. 10N.286.52.A9 TaxID=3229711 RepID=UPI00354C79EF
MQKKRFTPSARVDSAQWQAKHLKNSSNLTLTEAREAVAKVFYGFSSWNDLKYHINKTTAGPLFKQLNVPQMLRLSELNHNDLSDKRWFHSIRAELAHRLNNYVFLNNTTKAQIELITKIFRFETESLVDSDVCIDHLTNLFPFEADFFPETDCKIMLSELNGKQFILALIPVFDIAKLKARLSDEAFEMLEDEYHYMLTLRETFPVAWTDEYRKIWEQNCLQYIESQKLRKTLDPEDYYESLDFADLTEGLCNQQLQLTQWLQKALRINTGDDYKPNLVSIYGNSYCIYGFQVVDEQTEDAVNKLQPFKFKYVGIEDSVLCVTSPKEYYEHVSNDEFVLDIFPDCLKSIYQEYASKKQTEYMVVISPVLDNKEYRNLPCPSTSSYPSESDFSWYFKYSNSNVVDFVGKLKQVYVEIKSSNHKNYCIEGVFKIGNIQLCTGKAGEEWSFENILLENRLKIDGKKFTQFCLSNKFDLIVAEIGLKKTLCILKTGLVQSERLKCFERD